jgi:L-ascorbate metabolism protein UlaG (beta-lactamase superfamily)
MTAEDGLELSRTIRPRLTIPVHYEGWTHFRDGRTALARAESAQHGSGGAFTVLTPGKRTKVA